MGGSPADEVARTHKGRRGKEKRPRSSTWRLLGLPVFAIAAWWLTLLLRQRPPSWLDMQTGAASMFQGHRTAAALPAACERYVPAGCYHLPGKLEPRQAPTPTSRVSFDVNDELGHCPMAAAGRYLRLTGPWCLGQPPRFWQRSAEAARPTCAQGACCGGDGITGSFYMSEATGRTELRSGGCALHEFRRDEALRCLARPSGQAAILFLGDSMTRQIFLRLVGMFRGQERSFDYGPHNSARYDVCGGPHPADRFTASKQALGQWVFDQAPDMDVREVFDGRRYRGPSALDACREQPVALDFAWAGHYEWTPLHFQTYFANHNLSDTVITLLMTYHEARDSLPDFWKDAVVTAAAAAKRVILMTVPTALVAPQWAAHLPIWQARNEALRSWVAARADPKITLLDYDRLSAAPGAPRGLSGGDWHYQCLLKYRETHAKEANLTKRESTHHFMTPTGYVLDELWPDEQGDCIDDMNRILANAVLNLACNE